MVFLGFSAGLPYLLVFSTLSAWLRDDGVERSVIGFFSWIGVIYSIKVLLAPIVDNCSLPILTKLMGKRRSWMLVAQLGIMSGLIGMGNADAHTQLQQIAFIGLWVAFCSAIQDVAIDAFRIESSDTIYQGAMAATYVLGYRIALLVAGAGAFYIAEYFSWRVAYFVMAAAMVVGFVATICLKEPLSKIQEEAEPVVQSGFWRRLLVSGNKVLLSPFTEFFYQKWQDWYIDIIAYCSL